MAASCHVWIVSFSPGAPASRLMPHSFRNWRPKGPTVARSLSENSKGSRAWGLHGERKARGGGDVHAHRRRRATQRSSCNPHAPFGFRPGRGICFVGAPRRCAWTSPASRRLASAPSKPGTRPLPIPRPGRKAGIGLQRDRAPKVRYHKRCKCRTFGARRGDHSLPRPHGRGYFLAALRALMNWNMDDIAAKTMRH